MRRIPIALALLLLPLALPPSSAQGQLSTDERYLAPLDLDVPNPPFAPAYASDGTSILAMGGRDDEESTCASKEIQRIDPASGDTELLDKLPQGLSGAGAIYREGRILLVGGTVGDCTFVGENRFIYEIDPATGEQRRLDASLADGRAGAALLTKGNLLYVIGGGSNQITIVDIVNETTTRASVALPSPRTGIVAVWKGNEAVILSGRDVIIYDPAAPRVTLQEDVFEEALRSSSVVLSPVAPAGTTCKTSCAIVASGGAFRVLDLDTWKVDRLNFMLEDAEISSSTSLVRVGTEVYVVAEQRIYKLDLAKPAPSGQFEATVGEDGIVSVDLLDATPDELTMDWGDGETSTETPLTHAYARAGKHTLTLTSITGAYLSKGTLEVTANRPPVCAFDLRQEGLDISVNASQALDPDGAATTLRWNWGDGSPPTPDRVSAHRYAFEGPYTVSLSVDDAFSGAPKTCSLSITIGRERYDNVSVEPPAPPPPTPVTPTPSPTPTSPTKTTSTPGGTTPTGTTPTPSPSPAGDSGTPAPGALAVLAALGLVALGARRRAR